MKIVVIELIVALLLSSVSFANEDLRIKIENVALTKQLANTYDVYCVPSLGEAYLKNEFEPFWTSEEQVNQFLLALSKSADDGLNSEDYHYADLTYLKDKRANALDFDVLLSDAFLLYCSHLINGKLNPQNFDPEWHVVKSKMNPVPLLFNVHNTSVTSILGNIVPQNTNYIRLKSELQALRQEKIENPFILLPYGDLLKLGVRDDRLIAIKQRMSRLQYYTGECADPLYDDAFVNAIIAFQSDFGLEAKGVIGNQTIDALNMSSEDKIAVIVANMERMRWLPVRMPAYYLYVNIADFNLDVIRDGISIKRHKVIVGKTARKSPVFASKMSYLVFNPTWTVPPTILKNDVVPETIKRKAYLSDKNISVYNSKGEKMDINSIDWKSNAVFSYTYRQEPGPANALGAVKFMFPNTFDVYIHDTPSKDLFDKTERAFSSGCIRVQNPLDLAEFLLKDNVKYNSSQIQKIIASGITTTALLKDKPDVFLLYQTAWATSSGKVAYRKDIYGRDVTLREALKSKPEYDVVMK